MSLGLALAGCKTSQPGETTASLADADRQRSPEAWGERYRANPNDAEGALDYARALRAHGLRAQAVAVLERAATQNPRHRGLLAAYGARSPMPGTTGRRSTCSSAPRRPASRTGASSRSRARRSTSLAGTRRRSATMAPH